MAGLVGAAGDLDQVVVPSELVRDFNASVANLQLAYAKASAEPDAGA